MASSPRNSPTTPRAKHGSWSRKRSRQNEATVADRDPYRHATRERLRKELTRLVDMLDPTVEMRTAELRAGALETEDLRALVRMTAAKVRQREEVERG